MMELSKGGATTPASHRYAVGEIEVIVVSDGAAGVRDERLPTTCSTMGGNLEGRDVAARGALASREREQRDDARIASTVEVVPNRARVSAATRR
jgi:hypothetical protein